MTRPGTATAGGRPLDEELSASLLDAALRVLAREGYGRFSIAAVAHEAGVHRPAIYRRWQGRTDLAVAAIEHLKPAPADRDTGEVREDLVAWLVDAAAGSDAAQALVLRLQGDLAVHDDLADAVQQRVVIPRRRQLASIVQRGVDAGQLRDDLDVELAVDLLLGAVQSKRARRRSSRADIARYVDLALGGIAPTA